MQIADLAQRLGSRPSLQLDAAPSLTWADAHSLHDTFDWRSVIVLSTSTIAGLDTGLYVLYTPVMNPLSLHGRNTNLIRLACWQELEQV